MIKKVFIQAVDLSNASQTYGEAITLLEKDTPISLLVWNANKINPLELMKSLKKCAQQPHFLLLQEVGLYQDNDRPFTYWDKHQWVMGKNLYLPRKKIFSGVKTGSNFNFDKFDIWHSQDQEPFIKVPKVGVSSLHKIRNDFKRLLVVNVHFLNFVRQTTFLKELNTLKSIIAGHSGPIIIAGDFNTWSVFRYQSLIGFAQKSNLNEVVFKEKNIHRFMRKQLSFVFTKNIKVLHASILKSITLSDHYPMLIQIKL